MLTLDPALFPKLTTRRALVVVDAQNDFLDPDVGALPVLEPPDLADRLARLAKAFRPYGDVVWIRSEYRESRATEDESVVTSDAPVVAAGRRAVARGRRAQTNPHDLPTATCPEAFLTAGGGPERPACVRRGTPGAAFPAVLGDAVQPRDLQSVKTHYSAFRSDELLPRLRMKLVQELFICGSLTNMGVQATAMDAASHGLDITIVEDCCGYRSLNRHKNALRQIIKTTSCETVTLDAIVDRLSPKKPANGEDTVPQRPEAERTPSSSSRDPIPTPAPAEVLSSFANMSIDEAPRDGGVKSKVESKKAISTVLVEADSETHVPSRAGPASTDDARAELAADESPPATDDKQPGPEPLRPADDRDGSAAPQAKSLEDALDSLTINGDTAAAGGESKAVVQTKEPEAPPLPTKSANPKVSENPGDEPPNAVAEEPCDMDPKGAKPSQSEPLCEGDTRIHYDVLPDELLEGIFERLRDEVQWLRMSHQGGEVPRLVAVQGEVDEEGSIPIYRHPADESPPLLPWTKTVREIKEVAERKVGHELNHALIQFYRDGTDYISEHSDKTLDIAHDSYIVNVSLGAERTMVFRTKRQPKPANGSEGSVASEAKSATATGGNSNGAGAKREQQRARLPHNSLCQMGLRTNMRWLHAIKQDKRPGREKTEAELAFGGARVSLTFRRIGTFLDAGGQRIWGQGATGKTRAAAGVVADGGTTTSAAVAMLRAFGRENQDAVFDWAHHYGAGFDVVHLPASPRLFTSADPIANARVQLMLAERGVGYARGTLAPVMVPTAVAPSPTPDVTAAAAAAAPPIKLVDNDPARSTVHGDLAILLYLDHAYPAATGTTAADRARQYTRLQQALALPSALALAASTPAAAATTAPAEDDTTAAAAAAAAPQPQPPLPPSSSSPLAVWETYAAEAAYLSGDDAAPGLPDFAVWPVLRAVREPSGGGLAAYPALEAYYGRVAAREAGQRVLGLGSAAGAGAAVASPRRGEGPGGERKKGTGEKEVSK